MNYGPISKCKKLGLYPVLWKGCEPKASSHWCKQLQYHAMTPFVHKYICISTVTSRTLKLTSMQDQLLLYQGEPILGLQRRISTLLLTICLQRNFTPWCLQAWWSNSRPSQKFTSKTWKSCFGGLKSSKYAACKLQRQLLMMKTRTIPWLRSTQIIYSTSDIVWSHDRRCRLISLAQI